MVFLAALLLALVLVLLLPRRARAHDMWLEPDAAPDNKTNLRLLLGDHFVAEEEKPYSSEIITHFALHDPDGRQRSLLDDSRDGRTPALVLPGSNLGGKMVTMDRAPRFLMLSPDKFDVYLREENLEAVRAERRNRGEVGLPGREKYTRCLKAILAGSDLRTVSQAVGQRLEIVPFFAPGELSAGVNLSFQVVADRKILRNAPIRAYVRTKAGVIETRNGMTDAQGSVSFAFGGGAWLVRTVTMHRIEGENADWESTWTALRFNVRG